MGRPAMLTERRDRFPVVEDGTQDDLHAEQGQGDAARAADNHDTRTDPDVTRDWDAGIDDASSTPQAAAGASLEPMAMDAPGIAGDRVAPVKPSQEASVLVLIFMALVAATLSAAAVLFLF